MGDTFLHGTAHKAPADLRAAIEAEADTLALWQGLTALGRNEFICWVEDAKQSATRARRVRRACEELLEGKRRPCCWAGCVHREDKAPGRWQRAMLAKGR